MQHFVTIMGPCQAQNELLASYLKDTLNMACDCTDFSHRDLWNCCPQESQWLILLDCRGKDFEDLTKDLHRLRRLRKDHDILAFFNLSEDLTSEVDFVFLGVKGFFYINSPLAQLVKGIEAMLKGQLWVSRKAMADYINQTDAALRQYKAQEHTLTEREKQILGRISGGASNDEVADVLCISPHTVRTHLYNIFRKIEVKNRLEAALWATKHLEC